MTNAAYPYPNQYQPTPLVDAVDTGSPWLGRISLAVVLVTLLVAAAMSVPVGSAMAAAMYPGGYVEGAEAATLPDSVLAVLVGQLAIVTLICFPGMAAWITSIVAIATRRGRVPGIAGIVIGVLAPFIIFAAFCVGVAAGMQLS